MDALPWTIEGDRYQPALLAFVSSNAAPMSVQSTNQIIRYFKLGEIQRELSAPPGPILSAAACWR
jgi:hypothetical protein